MAMTVEDALAQLQSLGNEKVRAHSKKNGAGDNQFGVRHGDIRKLAARIKFVSFVIPVPRPSVTSRPHIRIK
jgi:hypothetical protein